MISVLKIHDTVLKVSCEAKLLAPEIPLIRSEDKLLSELILCILSSQEKYEAALSMLKSLQKNDILRIPKNKSEFKKIKMDVVTLISEPVRFKYNDKIYSRRLRFFMKKGKFIVDTMENVYLNNLTIGKIIDQSECIYETRKCIIRYSYGIGPKQASMFLRNIGYCSEFAVLDKHVIDYMKLMGLGNVNVSNFSNLLIYQKFETKLKSYAQKHNINMLHLDMAIWSTMRTLKRFQDE